MGDQNFKTVNIGKIEKLDTRTNIEKEFKEKLSKIMNAD